MRLSFEEWLNVREQAVNNTQDTKETPHQIRQAVSGALEKGEDPAKAATSAAANLADDPRADLEDVTAAAEVGKNLAPKDKTMQTQMMKKKAKKKSGKK